jgi:tripeptide aminopeptidase
MHPGTSKNKMKNASLIAMEFAAMLPAAERPEHTEGYEGFFHLLTMEGKVEQAKLEYIVLHGEHNSTVTISRSLKLNKQKSRIMYDNTSKHQ